MPAYAESSEVLCRFDAENDRDHWVEMAGLVRDPLEPDDDRIEQLARLAECGLVRWREVEDPDARVSYEVPDRVTPAQVSELPPGQARAYWLCDHEDGPGLTHREAAELLETSTGNVYNMLEGAREKRDGQDDASR